jgi:aryl-alcohol dehydrogenase-like predicted oxidoreductase
MTKAWGRVDPENPGNFMVAFDPSQANTREYVNQGGLSRAALFNQVDASLKRLQTDYVDVLFVHAPDPTTPYEETMKALHDLVTSGKVRYVGASNIRAWQMAEMNSIAERKGWTEFIVMQLEHSLLYRAEVHTSLSFFIVY